MFNIFCFADERSASETENVLTRNGQVALMWHMPCHYGDSDFKLNLMDLIE